MTEPKPGKVVPAKVVDVDTVEPIDAVVVGDKRNTLGRQLGIFGLVLIVLFFIINGYIQSSKNGRALRHAATDRSNLITTIDSQTKLIKKLQEAIRAQNKVLRKAGFKTVQIPGRDHTTTANPVAPRPSESPQSTPTHAHNSHKPTPKPSNSPTSKPTHPPPPGPVDEARDKVCSLTGICVIDLSKFLILF